MKLRILVLILLFFTAVIPLSSEENIDYKMLNKAKTHVQAKFTLKGSAEKVWRLITDYKNSHKIMPNIKETVVLNRDKNTVTVKTKVKSGLFSLSYKSKLLEDKKNYSLSWDQVEGPFSTNKGCWILKPLAKNKTSVTYRIHLGHRFMPDTLKYLLIKRSIPNLYESLCKQLKK